jgi:hypothetical protein
MGGGGIIIIRPHDEKVAQEFVGGTLKTLTLQNTTGTDKSVSQSDLAALFAEFVPDPYTEATISWDGTNWSLVSRS